MIDSDAAFRAILAAATPVTTLTSTRMYEGFLPEGASAGATIARPAITFEVDEAAGGEDHALPIIDIPYTVRCWASSTLGARALYRVVKDAVVAVNNQVFASVFCYEAWETQTGRNNEHETGGCYCEGILTVSMRTA